MYVVQFYFSKFSDANDFCEEVMSNNSDLKPYVCNQIEYSSYYKFFDKLDDSEVSKDGN